MRINDRRETVPTLGALEIAVLRQIWASPGPLDAWEVLAGVGKRRISLSTVQSTLERLHRKALLVRIKVRRAYRYSPAVSQARLIGLLINDLSQRLAEGEFEPVISGFVELVGDAKPELLAQLRTEAAEQQRKQRK
jgi:predicted transcriptional regulator